jgi:hypothetical protein
MRSSAATEAQPTAAANVGTPQGSPSDSSHADINSHNRSWQHYSFIHTTQILQPTNYKPTFKAQGQIHRLLDSADPQNFFRFMLRLTANRKLISDDNVPCVRQHHTTQHNTTQRNTTQHHTTQRNPTQHNTTTHNTTPHNTAPHNTPHKTTQRKTTQHNATPHNTTQHTTQHHTTQHHTTQHSTQ